jgi:hypothetical protein
MKDLRKEAGKWIEQNPEAMSYFREFARQKISRRQRFGIAAVAERVRWEMNLSTTSEDGFKINNNHRAYIARRLIEEMPEVAGLIRMKSVRCEKNLF